MVKQTRSMYNVGKELPSIANADLGLGPVFTIDPIR